MTTRPTSAGTRRAGRRKGVRLCGLAACVAAVAVLAWPGGGRGQVTVRREKLTPIQGMRIFHARRKDDQVVKLAHLMLWTNIDQPEVMALLASSLERSGRKRQAAAWYGILLLELKKAPAAAVRKYKAKAARAFRRLSGRPRPGEGPDKAGTPRRFTKPEAVDDAWMTRVSADLHNLHALYAWKLVGGRKDMKPGWIHNTKGQMHASGMKYVDEVQGRKGVLFTVPVKSDPASMGDKHMQATLKRLGHPTHVTLRNTARRPFLRTGLKGYGFGFLLNVYVDNRKVLSRQIPKDPWTDLKIDLRPPATATAPAGKGPQTVILELTLPKGQRWSEGVWFDYIDFFDD